MSDPPTRPNSLHRRPIPDDLKVERARYFKERDPEFEFPRRKDSFDCSKRPVVHAGIIPDWATKLVNQARRANIWLKEKIASINAENTEIKTPEEIEVNEREMEKNHVENKPENREIEFSQSNSREGVGVTTNASPRPSLNMRMRDSYGR